MCYELKLIIFEIFAYLCGSIPFGLIISKLVKNIDIRNYGSHNIGSTNVARIFGCDKEKGSIAIGKVSLNIGNDPRFFCELIKHFS